MIGAGALTLPRSAAQSDSPSGWIMILLQSIIFIIIGLLFLPFLQKNSGKTLYELNRDITGNIVGSLLNLFMSLYFIAMVCFQAAAGRGREFLSFEKYTDGNYRIYFSRSRHLSRDRRRLSGL